ncbi:MAG: ABC transporter permease [Candidatus Altiarchaeota archaeon]|nr:ABC transporter permease [Candidatus Altiarchaeota archaeon]
MDGFKPSDVAEDIKKELRRKHGVKEDEEDFSVQTAEQMIKSFLVILNMIQWVLTGIALISLAVGCIGIMTTMYTSVLERTNQIGVMKAVGATRSDILLLFMIEAGMLGVVGGVIGCILGLALSNGVVFLSDRYWEAGILKANMSPLLLLGVVVLSFVMGSLSGLLPAWRAAKLTPVEAIRSR